MLRNAVRNLVYMVNIKTRTNLYDWLVPQKLRSCSYIASAYTIYREAVIEKHFGVRIEVLRSAANRAKPLPFLGAGCCTYYMDMPMDIFWMSFSVCRTLW